MADDFCKACGASFPHRYGEGRCDVCLPRAFREVEAKAYLKKCYQCEKDVVYLFEDGRCGECTRLTPEEVRGECETDND